MLEKIYVVWCDTQKYNNVDPRTWYYSGCDSFSENFVNNIYLYPADGSCFSPTGGFSTGWTYRINIINDTAVSVTYFFGESCTNLYASNLYLLDTCSYNDYNQFTIFQSMPSNQYWVDLQYLATMERGKLS